MSGVTYHGEYPEGQDYIDHRGYRFERGKPTSITDKAELRKFAGNRFFKTPESDKDEVEQGKDEAEAAEVQSLQTWLNEHEVPFHHRTGLSKLRELKEDYEKRVTEAQAD